MKTKRFYFAFLIALVGLMSIFSFVQINPKETYALSGESIINVWDGNAVTSTPSSLDYIENGNDIYIFSAKGFVYFSSQRATTLNSNNVVHLKTDIDLNNKNFTPICTSNNSSYAGFAGEFDGENHTIYNAKIQAIHSNSGLFAASCGTIKNLNIKNISIGASSASIVGGLVGTMNGGKIENCSVSGTITPGDALNSYVGGLVGSCSHPGTAVLSADILKSKADIKINKGVYIGGLVGYNSNNLKIEECFATGTIDDLSRANYVGGIIGNFYSSSVANVTMEVKNCYNIADINFVASSNQPAIGGILGGATGTAVNPGLKIENCYNAGTINLNNANAFVGGLVGDITRIAGGNTAYIKSSFNFGEILNISDATIVSSIAHISTNNSPIDTDTAYYDKSITIGNKDSEYYKPTLGLLNKVRSFEYIKSYLNWDVYNIWDCEDGINGILPYLKRCAQFGYNVDINLTTETENNGLRLLGEGTKESPYLIYTQADLAEMKNYEGYANSAGSTLTYFSLQNDIKLTADWTPIGEQNSTPFAYAVFDGNNYTIAGLSLQTYCYGHSTGAFGLFGYVKNAIIKDVKFAEVRYLPAASENAYVGLLVGAIENSYIINCGNVDRIPLIGKSLDNYPSCTYLITGINTGTDAFKLSGSSLRTGNLYTYDANGGLLYDDIRITNQVHIGKIQIIRDGNNTIEVKIGTESDVSYLTELPVDAYAGSGNYNYTNVVINEGYKLGRTNRSDTWFTYTANWDAQEDISYSIYYNSYESAKYGVTEQSVTLRRLMNHVISIEDLKIAIADLITDKERVGFEIDGIYEEFDDSNDNGNYGFDKFLDGNYTYLNNQYSKFYIKWKGTEDFSLNLTVSDGERKSNALGYNGNFVWSDAIDTLDIISCIKISATEEKIIDIYHVDTASLADQNSSLNKILTGIYNTSMVDAHDKNVKIELTLKQGFRFNDSSVEYNFANSDLATNLGKNDIHISTFGAAQIGISVTPFSTEEQQVVTWTLVNVAGDADFYVDIVRATSTFSLEVDNTSSDNQVLYTLSTYRQGQIEINGRTNANISNNIVSVGINLFDDYILTSLGSAVRKFGISSSDYRYEYGDATSLDPLSDPHQLDACACYGDILTNITYAKGVVVKVSQVGGAVYTYLYEYIKYLDSTSINGYTEATYLYLISSNYTVQYGVYNFDRLDLLAFMTMNNRQILTEDRVSNILVTSLTVSHYTNSTFGLIFSSPSQSSTLFYNTSARAEDLPTVWETGTNSGVETTTKIEYGFHKIGEENYASFASIFSSPNNKMTITLTSIFATFNLRFIDEDDNTVTYQAPNVLYKIGGTIYTPIVKSFQMQSQILTQGATIDFEIVNTDYYQWCYRGLNLGTQYFDITDSDSHSLSTYYRLNQTDVGQNKKYYTFSLQVTSPEGMRIDATDYTITIKVKPVTYKVITTLKFKQTENGSWYSEDDYLTTYNTGEISISNPNCPITIQVGGITGYTFNGFYFVSEDSVFNYVNPTISMNDLLSETYNKYLIFDETLDTYVLNVYEVYQSKYISFDTTTNFGVYKNYNGYNGVYSFFKVSGMVKVSGLEKGTYYYHSSSNTACCFDGKNIVFSFNKANANYYRMVGFAIIARNQTEGAMSTVYAQTIDTDGTLSGADIEAYIDENINALAGGSYYIVPLIEQKTLQVQVTDIASSGSLINIKYYYETNIMLTFDEELYYNRNAHPERQYLNYEITAPTGSGTITLPTFFTGTIDGFFYDGWKINGAKRSTNVMLASYFSNTFMSLGGSVDYEVSVEKAWTAITYYINYDDGASTTPTGDYYGEVTVVRPMSSTIATFDKMSELSSPGFTFTGYDFAGWAYYDGATFRQAQSLTADQFINVDTLNLSSGIYVVNDSYYAYKLTTARNATLKVYAVWQAKDYQFNIYFNGGIFTDNNRLENLTLTIKYNTAFNQIILGGGHVTIESYIPKIVRQGFDFDGFYVNVAGNKEEENLITNSTVFNSAILTFDDNLDDALSIYATWDFVQDTNIETTGSYTSKYSGDIVELNIKEFATLINTTGIELSYNSTDFKINSEASLVNTDIFFGEGSIVVTEVVDQDNKTYKLTTTGVDVGTYEVNMTIMFIDNPEIVYTQGIVYSKTITLSIKIEKANLDYSLNDNEFMLSNLKYIQSEIETEEEVEAFSQITDFAGLKTYVQDKGWGSFADNHRLYEFLLMKYFKMYTAPTNENFIFFRDMNYGEYLSYYDGTTYFGQDQNELSLIGERNQRRNVLSNNFFVMYDFEYGVPNTLMLSSNTGRYLLSYVSLASTDSEVVTSDLQIDYYAIYSTFNINVGNSYEVRAYLKPGRGYTDSMLSNYIVAYEYNSEGSKAYITIGNVYVLTDLVKLTNTNFTQRSFYTGSNVEITFITESKAIEVNGVEELYYKIDGTNFYTNLAFTTSNAGTAEYDTVYSQYDSTNHFSFNTYRVITIEDESYRVVNEYLNLLFDENFVYTVLNTKGMAEIRYNFVNLTKEESGAISSKSLAEELVTNNFTLTSFTYTIDYNSYITYGDLNCKEDASYYLQEVDGELKVVKTSDPVGNAIFLLSVMGTESGTPIITKSGQVSQVVAKFFSNSEVKKVSNEYKYLRLYDITDTLLEEFTSELDGGTEYSSTHEVNFNISNTTSEIQHADYYVTYSDLVLVRYNYNIEGATTENTTSYLRLGVDTKENLTPLSFTNLKLEGLYYTDVNQQEIHSNAIFTGEGGKYVGIVSGNEFASILLKAYWSFGDIDISVMRDNFVVGVGEFADGFDAREVINVFYDENKDLFEYTYELLDTSNASLISSDNIRDIKINLERGGQVSDNGQYTIRITIKIKNPTTLVAYKAEDSSHITIGDKTYTYTATSSALTYVSDGANRYNIVGEQITFDGATYLWSVSAGRLTLQTLSKISDTPFSLTFIPRRILTATFTTGSVIDYNGDDQIDVIGANVEYEVFEYVDGGGNIVYSTTTYEELFTYDEGVFTITKGGNVVEELRDAGVYSIALSGDGNFYTFAGVENMTLTINPKVVDLAELNIVVNKKFNTPDLDSLVATKTIYDTNEEILFKFSRTNLGEQINTPYELYLIAFEGVVETNYEFVYGAKDIFKNGALTSNAATTSVATLYIVHSDKLVVTWETDDDISQTLGGEFCEDGYTASLRLSGQNIYLDISSDDANVETISVKLVFFDDTRGANLSTAAFLTINTYLAALDVGFKNSTTPFIANAKNIGLYSFAGNLEAVDRTPGVVSILSYYSDIEFNSTYTYQITTRLLDTSGFYPTKYFDTESTIFMEFDGTVIPDITAYEGYYILGTYEGVHAGQKDVNLSIGYSGSGSFNTNNYTLSNKKVTGEILQLKVVMTLSVDPSENTFSYGQLTKDGLTLKNASGEGLFDFNLVGKYGESYAGQSTFLGRSLKELFLSTSSTKMFDLTNGNAQIKNANGYYYAGTYSLVASISSIDFEIAFAGVMPQIVVEACSMQMKIEEDIVVTIVDTIKTYYEIRFDDGDLGDIFFVKVYPVDSTGVSLATLSEGRFNVVLYEDTYLYNSIVLTIQNEDNEAFVVKASAADVYVEIVDEDILIQTYMGARYTAEVFYNGTLTAGNVYLGINGHTINSQIKFYAYNGGLVEVNSALEIVGLLKINIVGNPTDAGSYKLEIEDGFKIQGYDGDTYFRTSYNFTITKRDIDVRSTHFQSLLDKTYDGLDVRTITGNDFKDSTTNTYIVCEADAPYLEITARYATSQVSTMPISVSLFLSGMKAGNYKLSLATTTATIGREIAYIELKQNTFVYGEFTASTINKRSLAFVVYTSVEETELSPNLFSFNWEVKVGASSLTNTNYVNNTYLKAGSYQVVLSINNAIDSNYTLMTRDGTDKLELTISPYEISIEIEKEGYYTADFNSAETGDVTFTRDYRTIFGDIIKIEFTRLKKVINNRETSTAIGNYYIDSAVVSSSTSSDIIDCYAHDVDVYDSLGGYQITPINDVVYLLISTDDTVVVSNNQNDYQGASFTFEYTGIQYDTITFEYLNERYVLRLSKYGTAESYEIEAGVYMKDHAASTATSTKYVLLEGLSDATLTANLSILGGGKIKNVGNYEISGSTSRSEIFNDIVMGLDDRATAYKITVAKRVLAFETDYVAQVYTGNRAQYTTSIANYFISAGELEVDEALRTKLDEDVVVTFRFVDTYGSVVSDVGYNYGIEILNAEALDNYAFSMIGGKACSASGNLASGLVVEARLEVEVATTSIEYGSSNLDLTNLAYSSIYSPYVENIQSSGVVEISVVYEESDFAKNRVLKAGTYNILIKIISDNYTFYEEINGEYEKVKQMILEDAFTVTPKTLSIVKLSEELTDIFTKQFDGTTDGPNLYDAENNLRFTLVGVLDRDVVEVSCSYSDPKVASPKIVSFEVGGEDGANYCIENWEYGSIVPLEITIVYGDETNFVESNILRKLKYPLNNQLVLSANADVEGLVLPTPIAATGHEFSYWGIVLNANTNEKDSFLKEIISLSGVEYTVANETTYTVRIANNTASSKFINYLIGNDTENYFGYFYEANRGGISLRLSPIWDLAQLSVIINLVGENGTNPLDYAKIYAGTTEVLYDGFAYSVFFGSHADITCEFDNALIKLTVYESTDNVNYSQVYDAFISDASNLTYAYPSLLVEETIFLKFEFSFEKLEFNLNLQGYPGLSFEVEGITAINNSGIYSWEADYEDALLMTIADLPNVLLRANIMSEYNVLTDNGYETFALDDTTSIMDYVYDGVFTYVVSFTPLIVTVKLDFGDGTNEVEFNLGYSEEFNTSSDWVETPVNTGYTFAGWYDTYGTRITGNSKLAVTDNPYVLTAKWGMFVYVTINDAVLLSSSHTYDDLGTSLFYSTLGVGDTLTLTLEIANGYELEYVDENGDTIEDISTLKISDTVVELYYLIPNPPKTDIRITGVPRRNAVSVTGENITDVAASIEGASISVVDNVLKVETGKAVRIDISISENYQITNIWVSDITLSVDIVYDGTSKAIITITGITSDITLEVLSKALFSFISVQYDSYSGAFSSITSTAPIIDGRYRVDVGDDLVLTVAMAYGYVIYDTNILTTYSSFEIDEVSLVENYLLNTGAIYTLTLKDLAIDETVVIGYSNRLYDITIEIVSYGTDLSRVNEPRNQVYIDSVSTLTATVEYNLNINLYAEGYMNNTIKYSFVGWSDTDSSETIPFSYENPYLYQVIESTTIYAIFSAVEYVVALNSSDYYVLGQLSGYDSDKKIYKHLDISAFYETTSLTTPIRSISVYYGAYKSIYFDIPTGYTYYGYAYADRNGNVLEDSIVRNVAGDRVVRIDLNYLGFKDYVLPNNNVSLVVIMTANQVSINIHSILAFENSQEDDPYGIGDISLTDLTGRSDVVNGFGYIKNDRIHYSAGSFENGSIKDTTNFDIIAYTGDLVFIKVKTILDGYYFAKLNVAGGNAIVNYVTKTQGYYIYQITGLIGGREDVNIEVVFRPIKNTFDVAFVGTDGNVLDAGSLYIHLDTLNADRVWVSNESGSHLQVTAYTNAKYSVYAYIRLGYKLDQENINIYYDDMVLTIDEIDSEELDHIESNYVYLLHFDVATKSQSGIILIEVLRETYTVVFRDTSLDMENDTLVTLYNVEYNSLFNLTEYNSENIEINEAFASEIYFEEGELKLRQTKKDYNFAGYFTYQNGTGKQLINASGRSANTFMETGYEYDPIIGSFVLSDNAHLDSQGKVVITLYLYWSYLKTQIRIEFVPGNLNVQGTAEDIITGVNNTNSWFNKEDAFYMEVAFNTTIDINAPVVDGYIFYRYLILQRDINDVWLSDVEIYKEATIWSTNEYENIIECLIIIEYFARIDVEVIGGSMQYEIDQADAGGDSQNAKDAARTLVALGYVDTTKSYKMKIVEDASISVGFRFVNWINTTTGRKYTDSTIDQSITYLPVKYYLIVEGMKVYLDLSAYDATFGQIYSLTALSPDGSLREIDLGRYSNTFEKTGFTKFDQLFEVRVGDLITFNLNVNYGYSVIWNNADIKLVSIIADRVIMKELQLFSYTVGQASAEKQVEIIPSFSRENIALYVNLAFEDDQFIYGAQDENDVINVGYVQYNGQVASIIYAPVTSKITMNIVTSPRYMITTAKLVNSLGTETDVIDMIVSSQLVLSVGFMTENELAGTIQFVIRYSRLYYGQEQITGIRGTGEEGDPYLISDANELAYYMNLMNSGRRNQDGRKYNELCYRLTADINLSNKFWLSIGTVEEMFNGTFDFNGHTVSHIYLVDGYEGTYYNGLFKVLGPNAHIIENGVNVLVIVLAVSISLGLGGTVTVIVVMNAKRKRRLEKFNSAN